MYLALEVFHNSCQLETSGPITIWRKSSG